MQKAFDTLLQTVVPADVAGESTEDRLFRYECICCGEEVTLAAKNSYYKVAHFKHKSGNNDKECEQYIGQYSSAYSSKGYKGKHHCAEFYYDNNTKCFYISWNLSEEEITNYENLGAKFEIRDKVDSKPFFEKTINHCNFPDKFILEKYASTYYVSNTSSNQKPKEYRVFNNKRPSFFKVLSNESGDDFKAKLIRSKLLYTGIKYFLVWQGSHLEYETKAHTKLKNVEEVSFIENLGHIGKFDGYGLLVEFKNKNPSLDSIIRKWGYDLESSEKVSLLWPPAYRKDENYIVSSSPLYLYSTFEFKGLRNVSEEDKCISKIVDSTTKISLGDSLCISEKNVEMAINKENLLLETDIPDVYKEYKEFFDVPKNNDFYLFSNYGVEKLRMGQNVFLTPNSYIAEYEDKSLLRLICFLNPTTPSLEEKVSKALSNFWITEEYQDLGLDMESIPQSIKEYIDKCKKTKRINTAVKNILEGGGI